MTSLIIPTWKVPPWVYSYSTTRVGGYSCKPFNTFNLAHYTGDDYQNVQKNIAYLMQLTHMPHFPKWLKQVHGSKVLKLVPTGIINNTADAVYTKSVGQICAVLTADCLPILLCDNKGLEVAAIHAGWRGLLAGVLENTIACFTSAVQDISAWLGPAIGSKVFEVGGEIRKQFVDSLPEASAGFTVRSQKRYLANLYFLARQRLELMGIKDIYGGEYCTFSDPLRFFSYRRDGVTGRMASLIWLSDISN